MSKASSNDTGADDSQIEYICGVDGVSRLPWRVPQNEPRKAKEFGAWSAQQDAAPEAAAMAEWADGYKSTIAAMTVADLANPLSSASGDHTHWSGMHTITKHKLAVRPRKDRKLLASLFEQQKQV